MRHFFQNIFLILIFAVFFSTVQNSVKAAETQINPVWIRTRTGYLGLIGLSDEYVGFQLKAKGIKLQDAFHALLLPEKVGININFTDRARLPPEKELLSAYFHWEIDYWRKHSSKLQSETRQDLSLANRLVRADQINLWNENGDRIAMYLIGLPTNTGVATIAVSPVSSAQDFMVKELIKSFQVVSRSLTAEEIKRISLRIRNR